MVFLGLCDIQDVIEQGNEERNEKEMEMTWFASEVKIALKEQGKVKINCYAYNTPEPSIVCSVPDNWTLEDIVGLLKYMDHIDNKFYSNRGAEDFKRLFADAMTFSERIEDLQRKFEDYDLRHADSYDLFVAKELPEWALVAVMIEIEEGAREELRDAMFSLDFRCPRVFLILDRYEERAMEKFLDRFNLSV